MSHIHPLALILLATTALAAPKPIFDGKTFEGWEGDTAKTWRIVDGAFVGGSLTQPTPRNEFLATTKKYHNFELTLKFRLVGPEGKRNGGIQLRSIRIPNPPNEMFGYQADIGDPSWWGALYDESRRRVPLAKPDMAKLAPVLKKDDWNDYRIRCEGPRIQLWINGVQTVDFTETDPEIAKQEGYIAVQVHSGPAFEAWYKDIAIEEL
ncbi:MAG: DUF1080 domain-containing protein [Chthoniobacteraceae bacterium]